MWMFMTSPVLMFDFLPAKFLNAQLAMQPRQAKLTLFRLAYTFQSYTFLSTKLSQPLVFLVCVTVRYCVSGRTQKTKTLVFGDSLLIQRDWFHMNRVGFHEIEKHLAHAIQIHLNPSSISMT